MLEHFGGQGESFSLSLSLSQYHKVTMTFKVYVTIMYSLQEFFRELSVI